MGPLSIVERHGSLCKTHVIGPLSIVERHGSLCKTLAGSPLSTVERHGSLTNKTETTTKQCRWMKRINASRKTHVMGLSRKTSASHASATSKSNASLRLHCVEISCSSRFRRANDIDVRSARLIKTTCAPLSALKYGRRRMKLCRVFCSLCLRGITRSRLVHPSSITPSKCGPFHFSVQWTARQLS